MGSVQLPLLHRNRILSLFALIAVLSSIARIGSVVHGFVPLSDWMMWSILGSWGLALYFFLGCLGLGTALLRQLHWDRFSAAERPALSAALGTLGFGLIVFTVGLTSGLSGWFAGLAPAVCIASCGPGGWRRITSDSRALISEMIPAKPTALHWGMLVLAAAVLAAVYLPILTPHNIQHDARWYHLPIAAQYAAQGSVVPFQEGWFLGAYPHFSSLLYTWALLLPLDIAYRLSIAAHMEYVLFLATIMALPPLLRRVLPSAGKSSAWAVFFLFPGYLTYDSNLSLGADHVAALWAAPAAIVAIELWTSLRVRHAALLGALCAAAALTKYSALCLVVPLSCAALVGTCRIVFKEGRPSGRSIAQAFIFAGTFAGVFTVLWAPHWLKNLWWYGDPLYPIFHHQLTVSPWNPTASTLFDRFSDGYIVHGSRDWAGIWSGLEIALSFGFETNDYTFHGKRPVFGFLFAAVVPLLPFLRVGRRTGALLGMCILGILFWYLTYSRDRYLQAMLPWLSTIAAAGLLTAWRSPWIALRTATGLLITLQLLLQADIFFLRAHIMATDKHPLIGVMNAVASQYPGSFHHKSKPFETAEWAKLGAALPQDAKLLVHRRRLWTGVGRPVVTDESSWQGRIDYDRESSPRTLLLTLQALGVTHVLMGEYPHNHELGPETVGGELLLWALVQASTQIEWDGPQPLYRLPAHLDSAEPTEIAVTYCKSESLAQGVYPLRALQLPHVESPVALRPIPAGKALAPLPPLAITEIGCRRPHRAYKALPNRGDLKLWWIPREQSPQQSAEHDPKKIRTGSKSNAKETPVQGPAASKSAVAP